MEAYISEIDLERSIQKLGMLKNSMNLSLEKVLNNFKDIQLEFDTKNRRKFIELQEEEKLKSNTVNHYLQDNSLVLSKTLEKYRQTTKEVAQQFENIIEKD